MKKALLGIFHILSRYGWTATLIILGLFAVGFTWSSSDELYTNIRLFDKAALVVTSNYVEPIDEAGLIEAGIEGMVSKLDNYSRYLSGSDYLFLLQETDGEFEGIGVSLEFHHDTLVIESVMEATPAYYQGLRAGDRIVSIDGISTYDIEMSRVKMLLRGQNGTIVRLAVLRPNDGLLEFDIVREIVKVKAVSYFGKVNPLVGYIRLSRFSEGCSQEVRKAIRALKKEGAQSLIFDLRDNPGGLLIEAVKIASMLLPSEAAIVTTRGRSETPVTLYKSEGEIDFQDGGLALIVDGQTASAAEILAGAIQDNDRGIIIGSPTYGKGLVQQILQFTETSALKLTTAKYYLPSGRCLQKPDWSSFELVEKAEGAGGDSIYATVSGRPVFGGGGIMPDVFIDEPELSEYLDYLQAESYFFDFSLDFVRRHPIDGSFAVGDSVIEDFKAFIEQRGNRFHGEESQALQILKEKLVAPNEKISGALKIIDTELSKKDSRQFDSHLAEIKRALYEAIVFQARGEDGLYRSIMLPQQPEIHQAIEVLLDDNRYDRILVTN